MYNSVSCPCLIVSILLPKQAFQYRRLLDLLPTTTTVITTIIVATTIITAAATTAAARVVVQEGPAVG